MRGNNHAMTYPRELETWWIDAACRATGLDDPALALRNLVPAAARLSDLFTVERPGSFADYASDPVLRAAYGIMFFPQTFARVRLAIELSMPQIQSWKQGESVPLRVLDLGSGSGASTLAAAVSLQDRPLALHAVDHSPSALAELQAMFRDCGSALSPRASLATHLCDARTDAIPGEFDLILASFVLNELFPDANDPRAEPWLQRQAARLAPGGVLLVIEPAGTGTCERLQRLRDHVARARDLAIVAPCLHHRPCPMLGAGCGFCHDVRSWHVPDSVNLINRRMFRSLQDLKYGLLVLQRTTRPQDSPSERFRLVAPVHRAKGRLVTRGCCGDGALRSIELMTRNLSREQVEALAAHERGDLLHMNNPRLLGDGRTWRAEAFSPQLPALCPESSFGDGTASPPARA